MVFKLISKNKSRFGKAWFVSIKLKEYQVIDTDEVFKAAEHSFEIKRSYSGQFWSFV